MEIIEKLEATKSETLKYFDLSDKDLQKSYGPDKWNVRYLLHHIADSESVFLYRIRRLLSEPKQVIWATDAAAWAKNLDYSTVPLDMAKNIFFTSRDAIIYYARQRYLNSDQISFVHSEMGLRTLKDEFDKVVWHNQQHLANIKTALREA